MHLHYPRQTVTLDIRLDHLNALYQHTAECFLHTY